MTEITTGKTKSSLYWNVSLRISYEIFRFATSIIVARLLEPKDFGIVSIATMTIYYSNTITNFGFNQALVQRTEISGRHINTVFTFDLTISICLSFLFFISAASIASFFNSPESGNVLRVLALIFIITALHDIPYTLLRRDINFKVISIVDSVKEISMSILTMVLAFLDFKYWAIVIGQLVPFWFATCYLIYRSGWRPKIAYHHASFKELFSFGIMSFVSSQAYFFSSRIDRIVIGKVLNPAILGIYDKARGLYQMPIDSISSNVNSVLYSSFSRCKDNNIETKSLLRKAMVLLSVINIPIYMGLMAVAPHFILVLFGEKWSAMISPLQILCVGGFVSSLNGLIANYIVSTGNFNKYTVRLIFATIGLFGLCALAVNYGISGVAAVVNIFSFTLFYLGFDIVRRRIEFTWLEFIRYISPALVCSILMLVSIKSCEAAFFSEKTLLNLIAMIVLGILVYTSTMLIIPSKALDDIREPLYRDAKKILVRNRVAN